MSRAEWQQALSHGDLPGLQQAGSKDTLIFGPANHTEYLNVAAYLQAFWGYIWPTSCHHNVPQHGMTLTDLMNNHYTRGVREAMMDLILGRSDKVVQVGDAVAYFDGCLSLLDTAPRCIGSLMIEDTLAGRGRPMIPSVEALLAELFPKKGAREWLPMLTIIYMAPGGHRQQWPMSITALLERLSWIVFHTRALALSKFQKAVQKNSKWKSRYRSGPRIAVAPPTPFKFLDIGTQMGCYQSWGTRSRKERYRQHLSSIHWEWNPTC